MDDVHARQRSRGRNLSTRAHDMFMGRHAGFGRTDAPQEYANITDFRIEDAKLVAREGSTKIDATGYAGDINGIYYLSFGRHTRYRCYCRAGTLVVEAIT